ncbi:MAG: response regulator transcription factor [Spirochaetales bacterium]|nr:response regulator transcription factor [Spirochaetales bacterium]
MGKGTILVVEDETDILNLIAYNLEKDGYDVLKAGTGEEGLKLARNRRPDLLLLDLMLPGINGLEICKGLKADETTASIPIIMVSARGEEADVVLGLELGADDYVPKPFSPRILLARVKSVLRRKEASSGPPEERRIIRAGEVTIDKARHEVRVGQDMVELSATEFGILSYLAGNSGWVFSRGQIIRSVKGEDYPVTERAVDVQILALRKKLGAAGDLIETVRGIGYRFRETP